MRSRDQVGEGARDTGTPRDREGSGGGVEFPLKGRLARDLGKDSGRRVIARGGRGERGGGRGGGACPSGAALRSGCPA